MSENLLWTIFIPGSNARRAKAICQYSDRAKALRHAESLGMPAIVKLATSNPERVVFRKDRPNTGRKVGLPQNLESSE